MKGYYLLIVSLVILIDEERNCNTSKISYQKVTFGSKKKSKNNTKIIEQE